MTDTQRAKYIMIGGFLGAGKSTSILHLARHLKARGLRVGLITNDQGAGLVDTAFLHSHGFSVEEIAGGCFCCRFNSLMEAADKLSRDMAPDVFVAEPVGSCTDLVASVSYPLRRLYGRHFSIAPLSVVVDPVRALRVLGLETGRNFSRKVIYVYRKQLEEADLIVINKRDLVELERLERLEQSLREQFPGVPVLSCSARQGSGLEAWFDLIWAGEQQSRETMELDYDRYAEGEALLGWLNCTVGLRSAREVEGDRFLTELGRSFQQLLPAVEIAHLKMTLSPLDGSGELAIANLVDNDFVPELSQSLSDPLDRGQLIINLRAEAAPEDLGSATREALAQCGAQLEIELEIEHLEHFRPARPVPTHRIASLGGVS